MMCSTWLSLDLFDIIYLQIYVNVNMFPKTYKPYVIWKKNKSFCIPVNKEEICMHFLSERFST